MRRLPLPLLVLALAPGCATVHEAAGNRARKAGDNALAVQEYEAALSNRPMMDFEFARIRDKRKRLVEGEWSPKVDAVIAAGAHQSKVDYASALLTIRRAARDASTTLELAARIDAELLRVTTDPGLAAATPDEVPARLSALLALFDQALTTAAPQGVVDAISVAISDSLAKGYPPVAEGEGLTRLEALLDLREAARARGLAVGIDTAIGTELGRLQEATFPATPPDDAVARFRETAGLRVRARALDAPPAAIALADRAHTDAVGPVLARIDAAAAAHAFLTGYDTFAPLAGLVEEGHPLLARLAAFAQEGAAWYTAEAARLPAGYRRLLQRAMAASLGGSQATWDAERSALAPGFVTSLGLVPSVNASADCAPLAAPVTHALAAGSQSLPVTLDFTTCLATVSDADSQRSERVTTEEIYYVQEEVQVGTRLERVQTGSHQEQCSQASSLEGYSWQGLCDVPDYENRQVPVTELRDVEKRRDVDVTVPYIVTTRRAEVAFGGTASATWQEGTGPGIPVSVPFQGRRVSTEEGYAYELPGRRIGDPSTVVRQAIPASFGINSVLPAAADEAGSAISTGVAAQVRAVRARLAREEGERASAAGDADAAGEAFVRSVLLDGKAEGAAATWMTQATGLQAEAAAKLLVGDLRTLPASVPLPPPAAYGPGPLLANRGAYEDTVGDLERAVNVVTTDTYQSGIMPPNEFVDFHVGPLPVEVQVTDTFGSRIAPAVGFEGHYGFLEMLGLRYGLVVNDQFGGRLSVGMLYAQKDYTNGEEEGPLTVTAELSYRLYPGIRTPYFGIFAGATAGYLHAASGHAVAHGWHVDPGARLTLRTFRTHQIILEASGFLLSIPGVPHKDRLMLSFPVLGNKGVDLMISGERTVLPGRERAEDGVTKVGLDEVPVWMGGVQVGARL